MIVRTVGVMEGKRDNIEPQDEFVFDLKGKRRGGRLDRWRFCNINQNQIFGIVTEHSEHVNGNTIRTSTVVKIHEIHGQKIAETLNSYYYLDNYGTETDLHEHYLRFYKDKDIWYP